MRLLLDAHISGRVVGKALAESGHDVRALNAESELEGMEDPAILELAFVQSRVLVTANVSDFEPLLKQWAEEGRRHAGVILVPSRELGACFDRLVTKGQKLLCPQRDGSIGSSFVIRELHLEDA